MWRRTMTMGAELAARLHERRWAPQATFAARLSDLERDLQAVLNRVPNLTGAPRVAATLRLSLDDLAAILPPAEKALLDHLRTRRPLKGLDGTPGFKTVSRRNERLQGLLSRVTVYCGSYARYDLMQPYDRPGHRHRPRRGPRRRMLPLDRFPPICAWVPLWFLAANSGWLKVLHGGGRGPRSRGGPALAGLYPSPDGPRERHVSGSRPPGRSVKANLVQASRITGVSFGSGIRFSS